MILDSSQRIVVAASIYQPMPQSVALLRAPPDGGFDSSFGTQGTGRVLLSPSNAYAGAAWPLTDGRMMVSGVYGGSLPDTPFLMRLNSDGSADATFGNGGLASGTTLASNEYALFNFLAPTKSGGWLLAGQYGVGDSQSSQATGVILSRFDASGNPDSSFGTNGTVVIVPDSNNPFVAQRAAMQPDGKLVVAGSMQNSTTDPTSHFAVVRILADYDTIFANGFEAAP
jgi:uncharacterized delta-60 repeat protein